MQTRAHWIICVAALLLSGCGSPTEPGPKPDAPAITCPANVTVRGVPGGTQPVTYPAPTVTGGSAPVSVTCTPGSGTSFSVGTTPVACTAVDASARQAQCSFTVTLTPLLLSVTKYVAFGDSVTRGEDGRTARLGFGFIDETGTYPILLQTRLNDEYPGQSIVVPNYGVGGEFVDSGRQRLPGVLAQEHPGAVLLLEGYNDLLDSCNVRVAPNSPQCLQTINDVVSGLQKMMQIAKTPSYGTKYVFVSTLTPPGLYSGVGSDRRISGQAIAQTNAKLAPVVRAEGAVLVDAYSVFIGHEPEYVADDGLHLQRAGYQALADTFFAAIKNTVTSTPGFGMR